MAETCKFFTTLGLDNIRWARETRMMGLPGREKCLMIHLTISIQYANVTDGHKLTVNTALTHVIALSKTQTRKTLVREQSAHNRDRCSVW